MINRNLPVFAIILLALTLTTSAFGQGKTKRTGAKMNRTGKTGTTNKARYANQEISYRTQAGNKTAPAAATSRRSLSLLPYMEQSNLRRAGAHTTTANHTGKRRKRKSNSQ
ncbi:MAG: hypothetical protein AB7U82_25165 [Blastocatellales bacterium]